MTSCRLTDEPLDGTAPRALWWWLIEAPGPWGAKAPSTSAVPGVRDLTSEDSRRVLLVRPTRRDSRYQGPGVRIWVVAGTGGLPVAHDVPDPTDLIDWAPSGPIAGDRTPPLPDIPRLLVCTNAARDACCGVTGRALLRHVGAQPGLWECSHLGGHRFAPTALDATRGLVYGRLTAPAVVQALDPESTGAELLPLVRGCPALTPAEQVAQREVWHRTGQRPRSVAARTDEVVDVVTGDDTAWIVNLATAPLAERPVSCGATPEAGTAHVVVSVTPAR